MSSNLLPLLKEGFTSVAYSFIAFILFMLFDFELLAFLAFGLTLFYIYLYRNPERMAPYYEDNALIAPVDGIVVAIEDLEESRFAYKITLEGSYSHVSVLRAPMKAEVTAVSHFFGTKLGQTSPLFGKTNETLTYELCTSEKNSIYVVHRVKQSIDSIHTDMKQNTRVVSGQRYGVMINGITEIFIPHNFRINIDIGTQVTASNTLLGYFS